jgi:hypothetical protein
MGVARLALVVRRHSYRPDGYSITITEQMASVSHRTEGRKEDVHHPPMHTPVRGYRFRATYIRLVDCVPLFYVMPWPRMSTGSTEGATASTDA